MDIAKGEGTEKELDALIEGRHDKRVAEEGERRVEALWEESVRAYHRRQKENLKRAWFEHEMRLYRVHSGLASEHLARAEQLENGHHEETA